jgi:hypothetical protein
MARERHSGREEFGFMDLCRCSSPVHTQDLPTYSGHMYLHTSILHTSHPVHEEHDELFSDRQYSSVPILGLGRPNFAHADPDGLYLSS